MTKTENVKELLDAGVHFGHLTRRWDPNMAPYIYMERNGIHIINLYKTVAKLAEANEALTKIAASGRKILFVATKKQAKEIVAAHAARAKQPFITERWPGGMLTNFITIRKAVKKMQTVDRMKTDGRFEALSKKEQLQMNRMRDKLAKNLGSIEDMTRLPAALFVVDIKNEHIAIKEAQKLNIPIFAMVDTNSDPREVDYAIPSNDDASKSIEMIIASVADAVVSGLSDRKADNQKDDKDGKPKVKKTKKADDGSKSEKSDKPRIKKADKDAKSEKSDKPKVKKADKEASSEKSDIPKAAAKNAVKSDEEE